MKKAPQAKLSCGRWGEAEKEKGPADLFPTGPTIEPRQGEETLRPWAQGLLALIKLMRKMGLEPTRKHYAQDP